MDIITLALTVIINPIGVKSGGITKNRWNVAVWVAADMYTGVFTVRRTTSTSTKLLKTIRNMIVDCDQRESARVWARDNAMVLVGAVLNIADHDAEWIELALGQVTQNGVRPFHWEMLQTMRRICKEYLQRSTQCPSPSGWSPGRLPPATSTPSSTSTCNQSTRWTVCATP